MRIRRPVRGRHRLAGRGLRHVRIRVGPGRRPAHLRHDPVNRYRVAHRVSTVTACAALATVLVSGWFAASGATAIAQMVSR